MANSAFQIKHFKFIWHFFSVRKRPVDSFTSLATVDLGSIDFYDADRIKRHLYDQIQNYQRLQGPLKETGDHDTIPVGIEDFTFRKFEGLYP